MRKVCDLLLQQYRTSKTSRAAIKREADQRSSANLKDKQQYTGADLRIVDDIETSDIKVKKVEIVSGDAVKIMSKIFRTIGGSGGIHSSTGDGGHGCAYRCGSDSISTEVL